MAVIDEDDVFFIKQGDLEPPLQINVSGSTGDLSGVESWRVIGSRNGEPVFDEEGEFTAGATAQSGVVKHTWSAPQTDEVGSMDVEARALWPGDRPQTFPPRNYCRVVVAKSLP